MSILNAITAGAGGVALSGDTSGNLTIQSAGTNVATFSSGGLSFSANPGGGNSSPLNDYETGTWTTTDQSGAGLSFSANSGTYTKIGRLVFCYLKINFPVTANGSSVALSLPFTPINLGSGYYANSNICSNGNSNAVMSQVVNGTAQFNIRTLYGAASTTNAQVSNQNMNLNIVYEAAA